MRDISPAQVLRRLRTENPWWSEPHAVPDLFRRWTPRPFLEEFFPLLISRAVRRAIVLLGPRRVGKTVLIHHAIQRLLDAGVSARAICYVSLDNPLYAGLSLEAILDLFRSAAGTEYAAEESFVFFDEIQYLPDWERHLKSIVDTYSAVKVVASGSAAAALRLKSTESGAGRFTDFLLPPLSFFEYLTVTGSSLLGSEAGIGALNEELIRYLNFGGYPEAVFSPAVQADPGRFLKSDIIDKVLLRDLPSLYGIQDTQELNSLFTTLAFNTANEVSIDQLAQKSGVAKNTIRRYLEYLEAAFLIRTIHRVDKDARHFKRALFFKVYLTNPSIRTALFGPLSPDDDLTAGALVETAVFAQFPWPSTLHYARWNKGEVDLVRLGPGQRIEQAIEVKWSDRLLARPEELGEALGFCRQNDVAALTVTTRTATAERELNGVKVRFVPAARFCLEIAK